MKEKIGMEKLIELLNEYEQLNMCRKFDCFEMHTFENSGGVDRLLEDTVISARYGFIGWLVENDKIDREQRTKEFRLQIELDNGSYGELGGEARLLMLLSISNSPIEDLISYLK